MIIHSRFFKSVCWFVVLAFIGTTSNLECLVFADNFLNSAKPQAVGPGFRLQEQLEKLTQIGVGATLGKTLGESDLRQLSSNLARVGDDILALDEEIQAEFRENITKLSSPELPPVGLERYRAFIKEYEKRKGEVLSALAAAKQSKTPQEAQDNCAALNTVVAKYSRRNAIDPAQVEVMPFRGRTIKDGQTENKSSADLEKDYKEFSYEKALASSSAPTAEDLAETEDIVFHSEIIEAATRLEKNPIRMFRFVADNCYYQPYYGSMKGSLETFRQQAGNDLDSASLLMALYRYSGIPCRYVSGEIEIPMAQALNYIGVENSRVMGSVLATNGVPAVTMINQDTGEQFLRMKHYWVMAWLPSKYRGVGGGNSGSWIYLDPSFKQHVFTTGIDTTEVLELDEQSQASQVESNIVHNSPYSFNFSMDGLRGDMNGYQTKMSNHFEANVPEEAPLQQMLNYMDIVREDFDFLPGSLPYRVLSTAGNFSVVPANMRFYVTLNMKNYDPYDVFGDGSSLSYRASTPFLAGKRIIVGYVPASSYDASIVAAYGGINNCPASAANLKPGVRINGVLAKEGSGSRIGEEEDFEIAVSGPDGTNDRISNKVVVGSYHAVALDLQGVAPKQAYERLEILQATVDRIKAMVDDASGSGQPTITVDRDDVAGEFLSVAGMVYWTHMMNYAEHGAMQENILYVKGVSEAVVSFGLDTEYFFGMPRGVDPSGSGIDVDLNIFTPFNRKGDETVNTDFAKRYGYRSSIEEHSMFDELLKEVFGTTTGAAPKVTTNPFLRETEAENYPTVSAVKALKIANDQGIPIYSLDSMDAYNAVSGELSLFSNVRSDIVNGLRAGKTVVVHQRAINFYDWHGFGYIITDQATGDATYMISSGSNGGDTAEKSKIEGAIEWLFGPGSTGYVIATGLFVISQFGEFLGKACGIIGAVWAIVTLIIELKNAEADGKYCPQAKEMLIDVLIMFSALSALLSIIGIFVGPLMAFVLFIIGMYLSIAIDILKVMLPIICAYIDALDSVRLQIQRY
ncbi:MAG TPA: transglutaminase domain-containing protein, partial [bacterium]|nr:transglutaminase domain-containing protein [bacterium]